MTPAELAQVFPGADRAGPMQGEPQAAPAFTGERLVGYVLSTAATVGSVGYSGKPLDILMGIDLDARVTGALLRHHNEPILVIGVDDQTLKRYVTGFTGIDLRLRPTAVPETGGRKFPDAIAGATVSSGVIRDTILRAGRAVARSRGLLGGTPEAAKLDRESFSPATWQDLVADGSIVARRITVGEVAEANGAPMSSDQDSSDATSSSSSSASLRRRVSARTCSASALTTGWPPRSASTTSSYLSRRAAATPLKGRRGSAPAASNVCKSFKIKPRSR